MMLSAPASVIIACCLGECVCAAGVCGGHEVCRRLVQGSGCGRQEQASASPHCCIHWSGEPPLACITFPLLFLKSTLYQSGSIELPVS